MSAIERACRWTIAQAYLDWTLARHATFAWRRYCAALGLDAGWTDAPRGDALMPEPCLHCLDVLPRLKSRDSQNRPVTPDGG